jgi:hypothetical protein
MFVPTKDVIYEFVIHISTGELNSAQILEWLKNNSSTIN